MSLPTWRTAYASAPGTSHIRSGATCQDAGRCDVIRADDGSEVLVASVSDGAGSAVRSELGARLVVESFQRVFGEAARERPDLSLLCREHALGWLATAQAAIEDKAREEGREPEDYACTILGAVVGTSGAAYLQIGDGAIVVGDTDGGDDDLAWVFWPQHGEYANSTFFVTMREAAQVLQFDRRDCPDGRSHVRELVMFSDGLERLILNMGERTVHTPSLRPILAWLATTAPAAGGQPSPVLQSYLASPAVNKRTDDDKTLVVATRSAPAEPKASA